MKLRSLWLVSVLAMALVVVPACGGDDDDDGGGGGGGGGGDVDAGGGGGGGDVDAGGGSGYAPIITGTWELPAGTEDYWCARLTIAEDTYIRGMRAMAPLGTHHTVLTVHDPQGADGEFACNAGTGIAGGSGGTPQMLYASGVGSDEFLFPDGVAVKVPAGKQVSLNLHLFNVADAPINGVSGIEVLAVEESEVEQLAEMVFAGTFSILIEGDNTGEQKINGSCTLSQDATILNIWPHMHQLGTHMRVWLDDDMVHDAPYSFEEQINWPVDLSATAGQKVNVECTYINDTGQDVGFGDSSDKEMCFAGFYRYPAANEGAFCTSLF